MMPPSLQKFVLLAHLTFSLGWLGAVVAYLALAINGLVTHDPEWVPAAFQSMELIGWFVIVPFSFATLMTGLVQSLGTRWGLFRHWWIVVKFLLTIGAIVILLIHMRDVSRVSRSGAPGLASANFLAELIHSGGGLLVLLAAATLSVFKPWGMTPYGHRQASRLGLPPSPRDDRTLELRPVHRPAFATTPPRWGRILGFHILALVLLFAIIHITGLHYH